MSPKPPDKSDEKDFPDLAHLPAGDVIALPLRGRNWQISTGKIGPKPTHADVEATEADRRAVIETLEIAGLPKLFVAYDVRSIAGKHYRLQGRVVADVVQSCVSTGEPVDEHIDAPFDVEFWPADDIGVGGKNEETLDPFSGDPPEPLEDDIIDAGRIVYETLAISIEPFPRHKDAGEPAEYSDTARIVELSPFSALKKFKTKD